MEVKVLFALLLILDHACRAALQEVSPPMCQTVAPHQRNLTNVRSAEVKVPFSPYGVVYARKQNLAFVALGTELGVLNTTRLGLQLIYTIPLPESIYPFPEALTSLALTQNGRYLLAATTSTYLVVVDVAMASNGDKNAAVGILNNTANHGAGVYGIAITQDDNTYIGYLILDYTVVGATLSPDDKTLYVASEDRRSELSSQHGVLSVANVEKLKRDPSAALETNVVAGCAPVRSIVSQDGKIVWVVARNSNRLLAFDTAQLLTNKSEALLASIQVGTAPNDLVFVQDERYIITANSNCNSYANATTGLSVVDVKAALRREKAVLCQITTGLFPREMAINPNGRRILVTDFYSDQVQAVDVTSLW